MFTIYSVHKTWNCTITRTALRASEGEEFAKACAESGTDRLIRVFKNEGITGEMFVMAWSVLGGKVTPHSSASIPAGHW